MVSPTLPPKELDPKPPMAIARQATQKAGSPAESLQQGRPSIVRGNGPDDDGDDDDSSDSDDSSKRPSRRSRNNRRNHEDPDEDDRLSTGNSLKLAIQMFVSNDS